MENNIKILLGSTKNVNSVNVETYTPIELGNIRSIISEYDQNKSISAADVFDSERQQTNIYRIYGRIDFLSLLNGLKLNYTNIDDLFIKSTGNSKTIINSFNFYLAKPSTDYSLISGNTYVRKMDIIATPNQFDIFEAGFTNNLYGDKIYSYNLNVDIDLTDVYDYFGFPLTEIYLYCKWKNTGSETLSKSYFNGINGSESFVIDNDAIYVIGDKINVDAIEFSRSAYTQTIIKENTHKITTTFATGGTLTWSYQPFIPLRLQYFYDNVKHANKSNSSYDITESIPSYGILLNPEDITDDTYIWRNIIPQGNFDPITDVGVDYPFINKRRYIFSTVILDIIPDTSDTITFNSFKNLKFADPNNKFINPIININNIGKPCQ